MTHIIKTFIEIDKNFINIRLSSQKKKNISRIKIVPVWEMKKKKKDKYMNLIREIIYNI